MGLFWGYFGISHVSAVKTSPLPFPNLKPDTHAAAVQAQLPYPEHLSGYRSGNSAADPRQDLLAAGACEPRGPIVDAAAYYTAVKAAMLKAKRSIILLGWDFDTRVELEKEPTDPTVPNRFGPFLERSNT